MDILNYTFFQNALWAILLISIISAIIGTYIVARRMLFITGGITHASFGGLGIGYYLGISPTLSALFFAILSALGVEWISRGKSVREDSAIAVIWTLGMAVGIIFIFMTPGYTPGLTEFLFGNILTITRTDILVFAAFAALLVIYTGAQFRHIVFTAFDPDFAHTRGINTRLINYIMTFFVATAVVLSIRLVGIMLLISILSLPQMIAELFCHKFKSIIWLSGLVNLLAGIGGLLLSYWLDVPAGATIVFTLIIAYAAVKLITGRVQAVRYKRQ
ncbi:metal ABC transporter permease [Barnesiella viscericola]|uniref:Membrane protein n=1 Tax=Barnesiella viscericola DSM 18177 TaxID=880074 RepID=W0EQA7_9BACT|nr:metal ABC transporter permease [Barnesiella viscericola]AHF12952.1 membrane protein [Barnesiella viscericola DSM 18177]